MGDDNRLKHSKFIANLALLIAFAYFFKDYVLNIESFERTAEEQNKLFKEGRSRCDGYKIISKHQEKTTAADINIIDSQGNPIPTKDDPEKYEELGMYWEKLGGTWGGRWKNPESWHFEA